MSENGFEETVNHFPKRTLLPGTIVRKTPGMSDPSGKPRLPRGAVRCGRCRVGRIHLRRFPPAACCCGPLPPESIPPAGAVTKAKNGNRRWPKGEQACRVAAGTSGGAPFRKRGRPTGRAEPVGRAGRGRWAAGGKGDPDCSLDPDPPYRAPPRGQNEVSRKPL